MPADNDSQRPRRGETARQRVGKVLRRGAQRLDAASSRQPDPPPPSAAQASQPPRLPRRSDDVGPGIGEARETFFRTLERSGDFGSAAAATTRAHLKRGGSNRSRFFAQLLQQQGGAVRQIGDICLAISAVADAMPDAAARLFSSADLGEVLRLAAAEYLRLAFETNPRKGGDALAAVLRGEYSTDADAMCWFDIAATSFLAGYEDLSRAALARAEAELGQVDDAAARTALKARMAWLREWYGTGGAPAADATLPALAVLHYRSPDRNGSSRNLGDYLESLAVLAQLARQDGAHVDGPLGAVVDELRSRVGSPQSALPGTVRLFEVGRDASTRAAVPDGTWVIYTGVLPQPVFGVHRDLPFDSRLRPIFLSVHVDSARALTPATIEYLQAHGPIGCRDRSSVLLLQAAGVPSFFAGSVVTTLGTLARGGAGDTAGLVAVDAPASGGTELTQDSDSVRDRQLPDILRSALAHLDAIAGASAVRTTRLQSYLAARSAGTAVDFTPANRAERRLWGLLQLSESAVERMRGGLIAKLDAVYGAILAGTPADEVYAAWRAVCAPDVDRADTFRADVPPLPAPKIDIAGACATIRAASTTVERTAQVRGDEINVELSLDGNYKHQLEVVLDSIVTNTARPLRAFVLCRDHTQRDFDRLAALFPEVSFVWLPTDGVDYGQIRGLLRYTTVATIDRLLLPDLLPEVSRIVHHDLDALALADLGELYDVPLDGKPLAARTSPQSPTSGYDSVLERAEGFRHKPKRGHEYLLRTHTRHPFDYDILNAGVMTLDLDAMRADDFCRNFVPYVERFGLNDQAVLNDYAGPNRVELDPGWNWRPWLETVPEPKIAHWAGTFKPWRDRWVPGRDLWRAGEAQLRDRYSRAGLS